MANTSKPSGLRPIRHLSGSPWNGAISMYYHSTAQTAAVYKGCLMTSDSGLAAPTCGPDPLGLYQSIMMAADDEPGLIGVAWTFGSIPELAAQVSNLNAVNYCAASTGMYIGVIDDPTVIYEIEGNSGTWVSSNIGDNCDTSNNAAGSTATGRSTCVADHSSVAASTAQLRVLRVVNRPDNAIGAYNKLEVMIAESIITGNMSAYATT
jgi:hypothetical protein